MPPKRKATKPARGPDADHEHDSSMDREKHFDEILLSEADDDSDPDYDEQAETTTKRRKTIPAKSKSTRKEIKSIAKANLAPNPDMTDDEFMEEPGDLEIGGDRNAHHKSKIASQVSAPFAASSPNTLQLRLNVGPSGESVINLNLADLLRHQASVVANNATNRASKSVSRLSSAEDESTLVQHVSEMAQAMDQSQADRLPDGMSFHDFPSEVRLRVYELLFLGEFPRPIDFGLKVRFEHSAHFLRTCKRVATEGAEVLYGKNAFHFERNYRTRGHFWEHEWKEIGFKDIRRFLKMIGDANISRMKYVSFNLFDALPSTTPYLDGKQSSQRRFVNDPVLHDIFDMIGRNAVLAKLEMTFAGRQPVILNDYYFLKNLGKIKCDELIHDCRIEYHFSKISPNVVAKLRMLMETGKKDALHRALRQKRLENKFQVHTYSHVARGDAPEDDPNWTPTAGNK